MDASKHGWAALVVFFGVCLCLRPAGQAVGLGLLCGEHAPRGSQQCDRTHRASTQAARVYVRDIFSFHPSFISAPHSLISVSLGPLKSKEQENRTWTTLTQEYYIRGRRKRNNDDVD